MATQDMPPPGGFASINVGRTFPKPLVRQGVWLAILLGLTCYAPITIRDFKKKYRILKTEQMEHYIAVEPFLAAERERNFLRHLRNIRDEERELMKDHPGWIVGTLYGDPIFKTLPKGSLPSISPNDYTFNRPSNEFQLRVKTPDLFS